MMLMLMNIYENAPRFSVVPAFCGVGILWLLFFPVVFAFGGLVIARLTRILSGWSANRIRACCFLGFFGPNFFLRESTLIEIGHFLPSMSDSARRNMWSLELLRARAYVADVCPSRTLCWRSRSSRTVACWTELLATVLSSSHSKVGKLPTLASNNLPPGPAPTSPLPV